MVRQCCCCLTFGWRSAVGRHHIEVQGEMGRPEKDQTVIVDIGEHFHSRRAAVVVVVVIVVVVAVGTKDSWKMSVRRGRCVNVNWGCH